jgi:hypothetical protein
MVSPLDMDGMIVAYGLSRWWFRGSRIGPADVFRVAFELDGRGLIVLRIRGRSLVI